LRSYTHGLDLIRENVLGQTAEAYTDVLGSVGALLPEGQPAGTAAQFRYDAFGGFRTSAHPGGDCSSQPNSLACNAPMTYTGHLYDPETGLFYFGARYYDPETGRFLTNDPVAGDALNPPSLHKYLYAYSSPMTFTDAWGEQAAGAEARAREQLVMGMSAKRRKEYLHNEEEMDKGIAIDYPKQVGKEILNFVPDIISLTKQGTERSFGDAKKFLADVRSHGLKKALENYVSINQERDADAILRFQDSLKKWKKKMNDPRYAGKESISLLVGVLTAARSAFELPEAMMAESGESSELGEVGKILKTGEKSEAKAVAETASKPIEQAGAELEQKASDYAESLGEKVIDTHYKQGAANAGFDLGSVRGTGTDAKFIVTEAKSYKGVVPERSFTTFGLGASGQRTFDKALAKAAEAVRESNLDRATKDVVLEQIENRTFEIRLVGSAEKGTRFTAESVQAIKETTGVAGVEVKLR